MRVLQVNKFYYEKGGTERYLFALSKALEDRGHEVFPFSMHHPRNLDSQYEEYFVAQRDYESGGAPLGRIPTGASFIRSREAADNLRNLLARERPDIAHLHNIYHQITPSIIPVLDEARIPIVMTLHDYKLICPNYSLFDGRRYCFRCRGGRFYQAPLARCSGGSFLRSAMLAIEAYYQKRTRVYDSVRFLLAPSRYIRDRFIEEGFEEERVVYLPAFLPNLSTSADSGPVRSLPSLPSLPGRYVLYFGRLSREKGINTLLRAVAGSPQIPVVIAGDGPMEGELRRVADEGSLPHVVFAGRLDRPALDEVIRRARVVVLPTESPENAPFTVLESMAAGVPVVVSNMGGLPELAEKAGGKVFPAGRPDVLMRCIEELWGGGPEVRKIRERSRQAIAEWFGIDRHMEALEEIYQKALGLPAHS